MRIATPEDLGPEQLRAVAAGEPIVIEAALLERVRRRRQEVVDALAGDRRVYGVTTGMGALKDVDLDDLARAQQSHRLLVGRAVGGPPWLSNTETRALFAVRLRTFLNADAGVSAELVAWLVEMLDHGTLPEVPRSGSGSAGEIIPLAHAFAAAPRLGVKEGVALLQGVPLATALALLRSAEAARLVRQWLVVAAAELALVGASRDPLRPEVARGDDELAAVLARLRALVAEQSTRDSPASPHLQAPVSFRVIGPVFAHVQRSLTALDAAVVRALDGVTDSPAYLGGDFVSTAGFHGLDLAAACDGVRLALLHAAEVGAARLHRLLDERFTGLPDQLSADPGPQAGLVAVHKRAVAAVHAVSSVFTPVGVRETSRGQEDAQSFAIEAADRLLNAVDAARDVLAAEVLAVHQGRLLDGAGGWVPALPNSTEDRPWGRDLEIVKQLLIGGAFAGE